MSDTIIWCENPDCTWCGDVSELVCADEDPDNFIYCPYCGWSEFDEEEVEE